MRVDFYILPNATAQQRKHFACRLAEKAWQQGNRIIIKTTSMDESQRMDDLLWTFSDGSFIPHALGGDEDADEHPIVISHDSQNTDDFQLLINLSNESATQISIPRVAEIVNQEPQRKQMGRDHFKRYREQGFELHHHEIKSI